jgi:hypothetical protein
MRQDQSARGGKKNGAGDKRKAHTGGRPASSPGGRPVAPGARPVAPAGRSDAVPAGKPKTPDFVDVPVDPDSDKGREQRRRKKKSKGAKDYAEDFGGKKRERVEVYKPDRMGRNRKGKRTSNLPAILKSPFRRRLNARSGSAMSLPWVSWRNAWG